MNNLDQILRDVTYNVKVKSGKDFKREIASLEAKMSRIGDRYEEGEISKDEYKSKMEGIRVQISKLKYESSESGVPAQLPENWREVYEGLSKSGRKMFWNKVISKIEVKKNMDIVIHFCGT